jgi:hypothetical protein
MVAHARLRDSQRLGSSTADPVEISFVVDKSHDEGQSEDEDASGAGKADKHNSTRTWMNRGPMELPSQLAKVCVCALLVCMCMSPA